MKDTTKVALQVAGIGVSSAIIFVGLKLAKNPQAITKFIHKTGKTVVESSSDVIDASSEVIDDISDSME